MDRLRRWLAMGVALTALVAAGFFWTRDRPTASANSGVAAVTVPDADPEGDDASAPPRAALIAPKSPLTDAEREERRFNRYDKDRNEKISRDEYMANRRKNFAKLDLNHDGVLSFEEYSVKATDKFDKADRDGDGQLSREEFAATAVKRRARAACVCRPAS
jgi:hypothetical protein